MPEPLEMSTSYCRTVMDVYRNALADVIAEVDRRVAGSIVTCARQAAAQRTEEARLTHFTRCLKSRARRE